MIELNKNNTLVFKKDNTTFRIKNDIFHIGYETGEYKQDLCFNLTKDELITLFLYLKSII